MTERISYARSGDPIVSVDGAFLHSRYDPRAEADRYVEALALGENADVFLLIEPGLGYLASAIRKKRPSAKILAARCSAFYAGSRGPLDCSADGEWFPDGECAFETFLEKNISDHEAPSVKVVEWKASIGAYGPAALELVSAASVFLKRAAANARTVAQFGRKWFRNAVNLASNATSALAASRGSGPVAVVAAGPSLEDCIPELLGAKERGGLFVVCVASAIPALLAGGLRPDIGVATDGGGWAAFHLHEAERSGLALAAAFTATLPSDLYSTPLLTIRDASLWQTLVAEAAGLPSFVAPQRGTVAATAVDLSLALTSGQVYLAGFDLGVNLGRTHARPNALDRFHEDDADRLSPSASASYSRFIATRDGGSLRIYADWMSAHFRFDARRIRILRSASASLDSFVRTDRIPDDAAGERPMLEQRICGSDSSARRAAIIGSLRSAAEKDLSRFKNGETDPSLLLDERSLAGELLSLISPQEIASAAAGLRTEGLPPRFLIESEARIHTALDELLRETRWTNG